MRPKSSSVHPSMTIAAKSIDMSTRNRQHRYSQSHSRKHTHQNIDDSHTDIKCIRQLSDKLTIDQVTFQRCNRGYNSQKDSQKEDIKGKGVFPIYTTEAFIWDNRSHFRQDPLASNANLKSRVKSIAQSIRKFSHSENCFYSLAEPKHENSSKGKIIRGIQSAKKTRKSSRILTQSQIKDKPEDSSYVDIINRNSNTQYPCRQQRRNSMPVSKSTLNNIVIRPKAEKCNEKALPNDENAFGVAEQFKPLYQGSIYASNTNQKMSASRALQIYSQVFKREDVQRVRVRKGLIGQSVDFCTKRVVLQQRADNKDTQAAKQPLNKRRRLVKKTGVSKENQTLEQRTHNNHICKRNPRQKSALNDENFDIAGWEVPQNY